MRFSNRRALSATFAIALTAGTVTVAPSAFATPEGDNVVINEVYPGGGNDGAKYNRDYVKLYNPTEDAIDVSGWIINQYAAKTTVANKSVIPDGTVVPAKGSILIGFYTGPNGDPLPGNAIDGGKTINFASDRGGAELVDKSGKRVDLVAWGDKSLVNEGGKAPAPTSNADSIQRIREGADTDDNATDFQLVSPKLETEAPTTTQADELDPQAATPGPSVKVGETPEPKSYIANTNELPADATYAFKDAVDTTTAGDKQATVVVTYADGSTDEVAVTVPVEDPQPNQGPKGDKGDKGDTGAQGPAGADGKDGKDGAQGPKGDKGEKGEPGAPGKPGKNGTPGADGKDGANGRPGADGKNGKDGKDGRGIANIENVNGEIVVTYTDGTTTSLGTLQGPKGDKGDAGANGVDGKDGRGIANLETKDGEIVVTYTDGSAANLGPVQGLKGEKGPQGEKGDKGDKGETGQAGTDGVAGARGVDGKDGRGVSNAKIDNEGNLVLSYSDGTTQNVGRVEGTEVKTVTENGGSSTSSKGSSWLWVLLLIPVGIVALLASPVAQPYVDQLRAEFKI